MLICCSINISNYYEGWKLLCCFIFLWKILFHSVLGKTEKYKCIFFFNNVALKIEDYEVKCGQYGDPYSQYGQYCVANIVWPIWWPILTIPAFNPSKRTHTHGALGRQCCRAARGFVHCSRAPQSWYWKRRERWLFTPPTYNSCRTWDSNPRPSGYKSDSISIRPQPPPL